MAYALKAKVSPVAGCRARRRSGTSASVCFGTTILLIMGMLGQGAGSLSAAEQKPESKLLFLVARPSIEDPLFAKSVVLMLPLKDEPLVVGLIINKPSKVTLHELFPGSRLLKNRPDIAYIGGPVDLEAGALVFHAAKPPNRAMLLYDDVYVSFDGKFITARLRDAKQTGDLRLFLGRAQWAPAQLEAEAFRGSWYSLRAEGNVIFEQDSEEVWKRMHDRAQPRSDVENRLPQTPRGMFEAACSHFLPPRWQNVPRAAFLHQLQAGQ